MFNSDIFNFMKPKNELENQGEWAETRPFIPDELWVKCPACKNMILTSDLEDNLKVCSKCGHHFRTNARYRINITVDEDSFKEMDADLVSENILDFPEYTRKLKTSKMSSGENESVICGTAEIEGSKTVLCVMDSSFMMGSMGTVTGEKITRAFEYATENNLPVVVFTVSGGARMQEGIMSLMQMAKTTSAISKLNEAGLLYISVLTDPTYGGVTASFASIADIILAEPGAMIGFAGQRVIEQTIGEKLPEGFQTAEFLLEHGFIDKIVERKDLKNTLSNLIQLNK